MTLTATSQNKPYNQFLRSSTLSQNSHLRSPHIPEQCLLEKSQLPSFSAQAQREFVIDQEHLKGMVTQCKEHTKKMGTSLADQGIGKKRKKRDEEEERSEPHDDDLSLTILLNQDFTDHDQGLPLPLTLTRAGSSFEKSKQEDPSISVSLSESSLLSDTEKVSSISTSYSSLAPPHVEQTAIDHPQSSGLTTSSQRYSEKASCLFQQHSAYMPEKQKMMIDAIVAILNENQELVKDTKGFSKEQEKELCRAILQRPEYKQYGITWGELKCYLEPVHRILHNGQDPLQTTAGLVALQYSSQSSVFVPEPFQKSLSLIQPSSSSSSSPSNPSIKPTQLSALPSNHTDPKEQAIIDLIVIILNENQNWVKDTKGFPQKIGEKLCEAILGRPKYRQYRISWGELRCYLEPVHRILHTGKGSLQSRAGLVALKYSSQPSAFVPEPFQNTLSRIKI